MKKRYFIPACVLIAVARPRRLRQATGLSPEPPFESDLQIPVPKQKNQS